MDNLNTSTIKNVQNKLKESFQRQNGWVLVLGKYVNIETGHVSSDLPTDISQFQEKLARQFSNLQISTDDVYTYFLSIKQQINGQRKNQLATQFLSDFLTELSRPPLYTECTDCSFYQQKCDKIKKIVESNYDEELFKQFLDFLKEQRQKLIEQQTEVKIEKKSSLINKNPSMKKRTEKDKGKQISSWKVFFEQCKSYIFIEDCNGNSLNPKKDQKKNKIIINSDKNKVQQVNEIIQKLSLTQKYNLEEKAINLKDKTIQFQFEFNGNDLCIQGLPMNQKSKAKESCCEIVINLIIKEFNQTLDEKSLDAALNGTQLDEDQSQLSDNETTDVSSSTFNTLNSAEQFDFQTKLNDINQLDDKTIKAKVSEQPSDEQNESQPTDKKLNQMIPEKSEMEFDSLVNSLQKIKKEIIGISKFELNPFNLNRIFSDQKLSSPESIKILDNAFLQLILSAIKLYDYLDFEQSPCSKIKSSFLKTLTMKKKFTQSLIGSVVSTNQELAFIFSAFELIYKFSQRHFTYKDNVFTLDKVVNSLISQAQNLIKKQQKAKIKE